MFKLLYSSKFGYFEGWTAPYTVPPLFRNDLDLFILIVMPSNLLSNFIQATAVYSGLGHEYS